MAGNMVVTAVLCLIVAFAIFSSGFFIFLFVKRKRLRTAETAPVHMLLATLAVVDIIAAIFWTLLAAMSAIDGKWSLPNELCELQVFTMGFAVLMNAHIMLALMFERFLRVFKPSKHVEIVFDTVVLLLIATLIVLDSAIAACPLWGWGEPEYFSDQYQCAVDYVESESHLEFSIAMHHGIPMTLTLLFYILILVKIQYLKRKLDTNQQIVLEKTNDAQGESYAERLRRRYQRLRDAGTKPDKTFMKEEIQNTTGAYKQDEDESTDEETDKKKDHLSNPGKTENKRLAKRVYYLTRGDVRQVHLYAIMAAVFYALWIPYVARSVIWTHFYFEMTLSDNFVLAAVILTHFTFCYKVPLYLISDKIRAAVRKTLGMDENKDSKYASEERIVSAPAV